MNKLCCLIIMLATCGICRAQNLVLNGDFETFTSCPTHFDQLYQAPPWQSPTSGSPEYYNVCAPAVWPNVSIPINEMGDQYPHSGNGYGGGYFFYPSLSHRQYLEGGFSMPLSAGATYYFEMYISLAEKSNLHIADIGAYFSDTSVYGIAGVGPLNFTPQILNTNGIISDSINWISINGYYTAHGGEQYFIIGNFTPHDSLVNYATQINYPQYALAAYYYVDDVSISLATSLSQENQHSKVTLSPTLFDQYFYVQTNCPGNAELTLFDINSRQILRQPFTNSATINTQQLAKGIYIYEVRNKNGVIKKGKVVKE